MSSSSSIGSPPKDLGPLHASHYSPTGDFENFNPNIASPAVKYRKFSERVNELISADDRINNPSYHRPMIPRADNIFAIAEDQPNPVIVGSGAAIGTGTIIEVGRRVFRAPSEAPPTYRSPPSISKTLSSSSTFISNHGNAILIGTLCLLAAAATYRSVTTYQPFAEALRTNIADAFNAILDDAITSQQLLDTVNGIIRRKEESLFSRIFANRNPNPMGYLLLTKGIALDSIGINLDPQNPEFLQRHQEAQQQYQMALAYNVDDDLRYRIHLAYARSLRLINSPEAHILAQLDRIPQHTPFHSVAEIERNVLHGQPGEIMDRYQYPFEFLCPITQDIMVNPLYHTYEEHRHYFEGNAIQAWLVTHDTCPSSRRRPLTPEHLSPDEELRNVILSWSPTKLKQNIAVD